LLAIPLFGESLHAAQWIGGMIVLIGIYLVNVNRKNSTASVPLELPQTQPE